MLNSASVQAVGLANFSQEERFKRPLYDSYCFARLPGTIAHLLTGEETSIGQLPGNVFGDLPRRYRQVILLFVDAFGWRFFEHYADKYPALCAALQEGVVSKLTSQFPSTTAAHVSCIHMGLDVGRSGIYEWNYYEPLVDDMITPLLFSYAGDKARDTLKSAGHPASAYFPRQTFYRALAQRGIASYVFQNAQFTPSTYSDVAFKGATVFPFRKVGEALNKIAQLALSRSAPTYFFLYYETIDAACHLRGPRSAEFEQEVDLFFKALESQLLAPLRGKAKETLVLLTADHGQIEVDPRATFYLNKRLPGIERYLLTNRQGKLLVPAGSARDLFLYVKETMLDEALALLQKHLEGQARVYRTSELAEQGLFGAQPLSNDLLARLGNVVILPYRHETVWWYEQNRFEMHFLGHHGGLLPEEMEIPLLALPLA